MANQERGVGRGIFGISAPTREAPVPVLPKPGVRPVPVPEPEKPPTKKPLIKRLAGNLALRIALAGTAVAGTGYAIYHEVPAIHQAVEDIQGPFDKEAPLVIPPDVFDSNSLGGTITNENTVVLSPEEIKKILPPIITDTVNNKSTILFPFQLPEGTNSQFTKTTVVPKDNPNSFSNQTDRVDIFSEILPIGTKIINPIEGAHVFLQRGNPELGEDPKLIKRAIFYWYDKVNDALYKFSISPTILPGPLFKPIIQDDKYYNWDYDWENLPIPDRGLEIMEPTQDSQPVVIDVTIYKGKTNSLDALNKNLSEKTLQRGNVDFFTAQGINSDGKTKLVVLEKQN